MNKHEQSKLSSKNITILLSIVCATAAVCLVSALIYLDRKNSRENQLLPSLPQSATTEESIESSNNDTETIRPFLTKTTLKPTTDYSIGCRVKTEYDCELWGIDEMKNPKIIRTTKQASSRDQDTTDSYGLNWTVSKDELLKYLEIYTVSLRDGVVIAESTHTSITP